MKEKATVIPIAAGKGGVGKSLITANLGIKRTAERVVKFWDRKINESAKYVLHHARKIYDNPGG